jgi:hypothetical protein
MEKKQYEIPQTESVIVELTSLICLSPGDEIPGGGNAGGGNYGGED